MKEGIIAGFSVWSRLDDDVIGSNEGVAVDWLIGTLKGAEVGIVGGKANSLISHAFRCWCLLSYC